MEENTFNLLRNLHHLKLIGPSPIFWIIKDKNIVVTRGKTGTRTLLRESTYSSDDTFLTLTDLNKLIYEERYHLHLLVREPLQRFRSGIFEEWYIRRKEIFKQLYENVDNPVYWEEEVYLHVENLLAELKTKENALRRNFHVGNWLEDVKTLLTCYKGYVELWNFADLQKLLEKLKYDIVDDKYNSVDQKELSAQFLQTYDNLSLETKEKIINYIKPDIDIWNELF